MPYYAHISAVLENIAKRVTDILESEFGENFTVSVDEYRTIAHMVARWMIVAPDDHLYSELDECIDASYAELSQEEDQQ